MRIGFDVSQTGQFKMGCGYFADSLARQLVALDVENTYILYPTFGSDFWDANWSKSTLDLSGERPNVTRGPGKRTLDKLEEFWLDPAPDHEAQLGSPNIVHSNNFFCPTSLRSAKLVYTLHDLAFISHPEWTSEANWRVCLDGVFNASVFAQHIIAVSEYTRGQFLDAFPHFAENRISVVHEASRFAGPTREPPPRPLEHLRPGQFWLASGAAGPRKNVDRLIEAYLRLRESGATGYPLVLFGAAGESEGPIQRLGYVDDAILRWLYENCFTFCYPSLFEGFGLPVVEAMSLGAPVLTSNVTSLPEVVGDAAVLVDPYDVEAIHSGMRTLAIDDPKRQSLVVAGVERSRRFSWRTAANQVLEIYRAIASEYPRSIERKPLGVGAVDAS